MTHFDAVMYALGLLVAWVGLIGLAVTLFVAASRGDACRECDCPEDDRCS